MEISRSCHHMFYDGFFLLLNGTQLFFFWCCIMVVAPHYFSNRKVKKEYLKFLRLSFQKTVWHAERWLKIFVRQKELYIYANAHIYRAHYMQRKTEKVYARLYYSEKEWDPCKLSKMKKEMNYRLFLKWLMVLCAVVVVGWTKGTYDGIGKLVFILGGMDCQDFSARYLKHFFFFWPFPENLVYYFLTFWQHADRALSKKGSFFRKLGPLQS